MDKIKIIAKVMQKLQKFDNGYDFNKLRNDDVGSGKIYDNIRTQLQKIETLQTKYQFILCFNVNLKDLTDLFFENLKNEILSRPKKRYVLRRKKSEDTSKRQERLNKRYVEEFHDEYLHILKELSHLLKQLKKDKYWINIKSILKPFLQLEVLIK